VEEAAIKIISTLNELFGTHEVVEWRERHPMAFQELIWARILRLEINIDHSTDIVFFDRGLLDGFAYLKDFSDETLDYFLKRYKPRSDYYKAFVLETIPDFDERKDTGRTSTLEVSYKTGKSLIDVYTKANIETIFVPLMSVDERYEFILRNI
jgi:predicted ATPase